MHYGQSMTLAPFDEFEEEASIIVCEHFWVNQTIPQKDSTYVIGTLAIGCNKVIADKICICIYCHEINICF